MSKRPTHRVYSVSRRDHTNRDEKGFWQSIGVAWAHDDGKGFSLRLDHLPLNGADIVVREPREKSAEEAGESPDGIDAHDHDAEDHSDRPAE